MKSTFGAVLVGAALVTSIWAAAPAGAQDRRGGPPDRAAMERQIQAQIEQLVQQTLSLDAEDARRFTTMVRGFQEERQTLQRRSFDLQRRFGLIPSPPDRNQGGNNSRGNDNRGNNNQGGNNQGRSGQPPLAEMLRQVPLLSDAQAAEVLAEMRAIRQAEADLYLREQDQLKTVLTPGQLVRYYGMVDRLGDYLARVRGGPGGPGFGPAGQGAGRPGGNAPPPNGQRPQGQTPRTQPSPPPEV